VSASNDTGFAGGRRALFRGLQFRSLRRDREPPRVLVSHCIVRHGLYAVIQPIVSRHASPRIVALPAFSTNALAPPSYVESAGPAYRMQSRSVGDAG
jgi:hypothetical protein